MIEVKQLTKYFGKQCVLNQINFSIESGSAIGLVAPNGSGKTTLMSIMMGILTANAGTVTMNQLSNTTQGFYRQVGFMQDNSILYPHLTGYDHLSFVAKVHGLSSETIQTISERVGNAPFLHKKVEEYSLGMKQQLLFAIATIHQPQILLLDEPFNGLDPTNVIKIRQLILEMNREKGVTIFMSSHNLDEIDRIVSRIFFLKDSQLIERDMTHLQTKYYCISLQKNWGVADLFVEVLNDRQLIVTESQLDATLRAIHQSGNGVCAIDPVNIGSESLFKEIYQL
ncbi:ABC transporter ATP-binding protein [Aerococcaceae bacterium NML191292]|nr:ABC transporter ATP-binding protein [Aerococcaceae bacterium NML191292]MCW6662237.1 ABC transporter ATP-binding protein [Aerococcaceae bacterium NML201209]MCW6665856.1 ABC transporter ATP-binding protein [Aerococcaceae bacterium NML191219]MCW6666166.1 ABC transporter ATP-binding protein [Aerococcaceae bacterium NML190938]